MHFHGGALNASSLPAYPTSMIAMNALPPLGERDAGVRPGAGGERIETTPAWVVEWIRQQHDGPYWRNGSLRPDFGRIAVPGADLRRAGATATARRRCGWAQRLEAPWELLAGPWCHKLPDRGVPGPRYPFLAEMARFFHRHLDDAPPADGPHRPRSVFFIGSPDSPARPHETVSGEWLASERWPEGVERATAHAGRARGGPRQRHRRDHDRAVVPAAAGAPASSSTSAATTRSARRFDSEPLDEPVAVFGEPVVRFTLRHPGPAHAGVGQAPEPRAGRLVAARHQRGGQPRGRTASAALELPLMATGWRFAAGHRIRVAVAASDWPNLWPLPQVAPLEITSPVELVLPGLPADAAPFTPPAGRMVEIAQPGADVDGRVAAGRSSPTCSPAGRGSPSRPAPTTRCPAEGWSVTEARQRWAMAGDDDPLTASTWGTCHYRLQRPGWTPTSAPEARFAATADEFLVELHLKVKADGEPFAERRGASGSRGEGV